MTRRHRQRRNDDPPACRTEPDPLGVLTRYLGIDADAMVVTVRVDDAAPAGYVDIVCVTCGERGRVPDTAGPQPDQTVMCTACLQEVARTLLEMRVAFELPPVAEVTDAPDIDGSACFCLCGARHPDTLGCCQGTIGPDGVRVRFSSRFPWIRVPMCRACIDAYPETNP